MPWEVEGGDGRKCGDDTRFDDARESQLVRAISKHSDWLRKVKEYFEVDFSKFIIIETLYTHSRCRDNEQRGGEEARNLYLKMN